MKLLYFNKIETNAGWGAENFLNEALAQNGIETFCLDYEKNRFSIGAFLRKNRLAFDGVLVQRGTGYNFPLAILESIRRPKILLFTELISRNENQHYLLSSGLFDHVFVRSVACRQQMIENGWIEKDKISLFLSSFARQLHRPMDRPKDIDVLFIGSLTPRRKGIVEELAKAVNIEIKTAFGSEMVDLFNRSKIVLNIHGDHQRDTETRVFEVLACKTFLITEPLSDESPFESGTHLVEVEGLRPMVDQISYYLAHPEARMAIAAKGYEAVKDHHDYQQRAQMIIRAFEKLGPAAANRAIDGQKLWRAQCQETYNQLKSNTYFTLVKIYNTLKPSNA